MKKEKKNESLCFTKNKRKYIYGYEKEFRWF